MKTPSMPIAKKEEQVKMSKPDANPPIWKVGTSLLYDPQAEASVQLPDYLKIFHRTRRIWIGGSTDSRLYLLIERLNNPAGPIPTMLAEGDLDLYLCKSGAERMHGASLKGIPVSGSLSGASIEGYLAMLHSAAGHAYLVLIAGKESGREVAYRNVALQVVACFSDQIAEREKRA